MISMNKRTVLISIGAVVLGFVLIRWWLMARIPASDVVSMRPTAAEMCNAYQQGVQANAEPVLNEQELDEIADPIQPWPCY